MICTLGDLLLDVVVRLESPVVVDADTYGRTRVGPGGQAANVAAWIAALGGTARFLGKRAADPAGRIVAGELRRRGVELAGPEVGAGTGTVVSIAASDGTRTMLTDRGVSLDFRPHELDVAWLASCRVLHLPTYSLARAPIRETALAAAEEAKRTGARVTLDLSSTTVLLELGNASLRDLLVDLRPAVVFGNEEELAVAGGVEASTIVVKRGAAGCVVRRDGDRRDYEAKPADVVDTTGAGDAFAAGFLLGGPELALASAARCVATMGALP
ncbi:MAG: carbohydrate kinase family protein [Actinomycetota bacterium]|nr:carbohydrate kinase family protein [Actinomycetota bacterium]